MRWILLLAASSMLRPVCSLTPDPKRSLDACKQAYGIALIHVGLGDSEKGLPWLERAIDERSNWLVWLNLDPRWDLIRQDARFIPVARQVGLP